MEEIIVRIDPAKRTCVFETEGFPGEACLSIQALKDAIGREERVEMKPDAQSVRVQATRSVGLKR